MPKTLREHRAEHMYSVRELARLSGISPMTILNVELRRTHPSARTMRAVSEALGGEIRDVVEFAAALEHRGETYKAAA